MGLRGRIEWVGVYMGVQEGGIYDLHWGGVNGCTSQAKDH